MTVDLASVRLLVATPAYNGVSNNYYHSIQKLRTALNKRSIYAQFVTVPGLPVDAARDLIGNSFWKMSRTPAGFTHLLAVDNDIGFEEDTVFKCIERDVDFAVAAAPMRRINWGAVERAAVAGKVQPERFAATFTMVLADNKLTVDGQGFARIDATGGNFMLLRPPVFDAIREHFPQLVHKQIDDSEAVMFYRPDIFDGRRCGEDVAFQKRWRQTGGDIWLLVDAPLTHEGPAIFTGNYRDMTALGDR